MTFYNQLIFLAFIIVAYNAVEALRLKWKVLVGRNQALKSARLEFTILVAIASAVGAVGGIYAWHVCKTLASIYSPVSIAIACTVGVGIPMIAIFSAIFKAALQFQQLRSLSRR